MGISNCRQGGTLIDAIQVEIDGEAYVLRIAGAGAEELLIDRTREAAAVRAAVAAGVAPELVAHLPDYTVTVTRFVGGKPLAAAQIHQVDILGRVAKTVRAYHDHPVTQGLAAFSPFAVVRYYYSKAKEKSVPLPAELGQAMELLDQVEQALRTEDPHCLCHNDLLLGNFIDAGAVLKIIDWEYAGLGDRFFDLGNFAAHNELSEDQERLLLEHYFGAAQPADLRRLRLMRLVSDLREATWGYLQSAISSLFNPEHYRDYGRRFLDRVLSSPVAKDMADGALS